MNKKDLNKIQRLIEIKIEISRIEHKEPSSFLNVWSSHLSDTVYLNKLEEEKKQLIKQK